MTYNFDTEKFYLIGDIHGQPKEIAHKISLYDIRDSIFVLLGDVGLGFYDNHLGPIPYLNRIGKDRNNTFYLFRGNHDNPDSYQGINKNKVLEKYQFVKILNDGDEILLSTGERGLVLPGGISVDRMYAYKGKPRPEGKSYWKNEHMDYTLIEKVKDEKYDFILAHTGPVPPIIDKPNIIKTINEKYDPNLLEDIKIEKDYIDKVISIIKPKYWINGHYHVTSSFHYNDVIVYALNIDDIFLNPMFNIDKS